MAQKKTVLQRAYALIGKTFGGWLGYEREIREMIIIMIASKKKYLGINLQSMQINLQSM